MLRRRPQSAWSKLSATVLSETANVGRRAIDTLLPPRCLSCGAITGQDGVVCGACWSALTFIETPMCARCGHPFEFDPGAGSLCGACAAQPPAFDRARALLSYDDASRPIILSFKNGDRMQAGKHLGRWMVRAGRDLSAQADFIAPVPLHWRRLASRRYNQSAELAKGISCESGVPAVLDLLNRRRATPSQGGLNTRQRRVNVRGAFAVTESRRAQLQGSSVILVDDVFTTGATVEICAGLLKRKGAARVDVLVLARVVRGIAVDP